MKDGRELIDKIAWAEKALLAMKGQLDRAHRVHLSISERRFEVEECPGCDQGVVALIKEGEVLFSR